MPYDELGNYTPGDEEPSLDRMRYELSLPETVKRMIHSPANELPSREQLTNVAKGFGSAAESLGRGVVAGIPGVFGDINALARDYVVPHLPEQVQQVLSRAPAAPTTEEYLRPIPRLTEPFGDKTANAFVEGLGSAFSPDAIVPAAKFVGKAAAERIMEGESLIPGVPASIANPQIMHAVKPEKGGNWVGTHILDSLKSWIPQVGESRFDSVLDLNNPEKIAHHVSEMEKVGYSPEQISSFKSDIAVDKWIDKKLANYVRNEMGTPADQVRELHERGVTHLPNAGRFDPNYALGKEEIKIQRAKAGLPVKGFATTDLGRTWEHLADQAINTRSAGMRVKQGESLNPYEVSRVNLEANPWLKTIDPETPVYSPTGFINDLEFKHLTDELKNAIDPHSDLPEHLRLKPEALERVTVPQAVERVAKINEWRAEQMQKAAKEGLEDFPVVHEDPSGYKIHELKLPDHVPLKGEYVIDEDHFAKYGFKNPEGVITHREYNQPDIEAAVQRQAEQDAYAKLDKALKNEGEQMGHCVGGYTDSVASGKTRIFSLRDPKGGAHATIEVRPHLDTDYNPKNIPEDVRAQIEQYAIDETNKAGYKEGTEPWYNHHTGVIIQENSKYLRENPKLTLNVEQIKGKGNGAVSDKYRTYVKDWLNKEATKIGSVEDLNNLGLVDINNARSLIPELKDMYGDDGIHLFNAAVDLNPNASGRFMSREDLRNFIERKPEPTLNFESVKVSELKKPIKVYHASDVDPMISTAEQRLIPESISTNINSPNYAWGDKGYSLEIPAGAKIGKLKNIEDLNPEGADVTRMDLGKALREYATENNLDAVFIKNVQGTAGEGEWAIFNPDYIKGAKHYDSGELVFKKNETVPEVVEQKMLQGIYRGYAGENPASGQEGSIYASPQRAVGEYYANKRAKQTGEEPHLEMLLVDPFKGREYGHATAGTGKQLPLVTRARELTPEEIQNSTKLYKTGGVVQSYKKGGASAHKPVYFAENPDAMRYELLRNK